MDGRGGSRIFEGGVAGVEYGRAPKAPVAERHRRELPGGSGGMSPREILKSQVSEMVFPAFWDNFGAHFFFFATPTGAG